MLIVIAKVFKVLKRVKMIIIIQMKILIIIIVKLEKNIIYG
jgi:hypothetical protein